MAALLLGLWCLWRKRLPWPMVAYIAVVVMLMLLPATVTARPAVPVHGVPAVHQRRRLVAAARPCRLGPDAGHVRRRAGRADGALRRLRRHPVITREACRAGASGRALLQRAGDRGG